MKKMNPKERDVEARHTSTIDNCAAVYINDPQLYITNPSDDPQWLRNEPVVRDFANMKPDIYELIKATNPTLLLFVDLCKRIVFEEAGHGN